MDFFTFVIAPAVLIALFGFLLVRRRSYMRVETRLLIVGCILTGLGLVSFVLAVTFSWGGAGCPPPGCAPNFMRDVVVPILGFAARALLLTGLGLVVLAFLGVGRRVLGRR